MGSSFRFEVSSDLEKQIQKLAEEPIKGIAADYQRMFDRVGRQYKGKPVAEIKTVLRREWTRLGGTASDADLTKYAKCISEGTRIQMQVGP